MCSLDPDKILPGIPFDISAYHIFPYLIEGEFVKFNVGNILFPRHIARISMVNKAWRTLLQEIILRSKYINLSYLENLEVGPWNPSQEYRERFFRTQTRQQWDGPGMYTYTWVSINGNNYCSGKGLATWRILHFQSPRHFYILMNTIHCFLKLFDLTQDNQRLCELYESYPFHDHFVYIYIYLCLSYKRCFAKHFSFIMDRVVRCCFSVYQRYTDHLCEGSYLFKEAGGIAIHCSDYSVNIKSKHLIKKVNWEKQMKKMKYLFGDLSRLSLKKECDWQIYSTAFHNGYLKPGTTTKRFIFEAVGHLLTPKYEQEYKVRLKELMPAARKGKTKAKDDNVKSKKVKRNK